MARITGGRLRGRVVDERVAQGVRPTSDRVREALFSIVGQDLGGTRVLDAFGGTGVLGIEAWSRGAEVVVVERDRQALRGIGARRDALGVTSGFSVRPGDVLGLAPSLGTFDGVLVDPPWSLDPAPIVAALGPLATSWLVLEAEQGKACPDRAGDLPLERSRAYGRTVLWVYRRPPEADPADPGASTGEPPVR